MAIRVLMEKGPASMFIPGERVAEYLADGWKEISREVIAAEVVQRKVVLPELEPEAEAEQPKKRGRKAE